MHYGSSGSASRTWTPRCRGPLVRMTSRSTSTTARAGADGTARRRRASPTWRGARPRTGIRTKSPFSQPGTAVAGTIVAPKPSNASEVIRRTPSISAIGSSRTPIAGRLGIDVGAQAGAGRGQQQALVSQVGQGDLGAIGERVAEVDQEVHVLGEDRLDDEVGLVDGQVDHGGVELAGGELGEQGRGGRLHDDGPDAGWAARRALRTWGTSHRAVVPITPSCASPATSLPREARSA